MLAKKNWRERPATPRPASKTYARTHHLTRRPRQLQRDHQDDEDSLRPHFDYPRRARVERLIDDVHALGARVVSELLEEACRRHSGLAADLIELLESYAALSPDVLALVKADRFPPPPLRRVVSP